MLNVSSLLQESLFCIFIHNRDVNLVVTFRLALPGVKMLSLSKRKMFRVFYTLCFFCFFDIVKFYINKDCCLACNCTIAKSHRKGKIFFFDRSSAKFESSISP